MKALLIDVVKRHVRVVQFSEWTEIKTLIDNGCQYFEVVSMFPNKDAVYVDEESLLRKNNPGGFALTIPGMDRIGSLFVGNGLIIGTDDEGDSCDAKTTPAILEKNVKFFTEKETTNILRNFQFRQSNFQ